MQMSHAEKLRQHLADKQATWTNDVATWTAEGTTHLLVAIDGPLNADAVVDAHVRALAAGARATLAPSGEASPVARRTAARLGIPILDAAALPEPVPVAAPAVAAAPAPVAAPIEAAWAAATEGFRPTTGEASPEVPPAPLSPMDFPFPTSELGGASAALDEHAETTGVATPAGQEAATVPLPAPEPASEIALAPPATTGEASPVVADVVVASSQPDPVVAHADAAMPWDLRLSAPEPEPVHVEASELAAMPWNLHTEQHEMLPAGRSGSFAPQRPTAMAQDWGLPWPRPVPQTGGLAIADPRLWHAKERIEQVREDLNQVGAPSFGAAKPDGSSWLKRLSEFP